MKTKMKTFQTLILTLSLVLFTPCGGDSNLVSGLEPIVEYAKNGGQSPSAQDYLDAGITGINSEEELAEINQVIEGLTAEEVDTREEVQVLVDVQSIIKVDVLTKTSNSWNGEVLPSYAKGKPEITILRIVIPPKTEIPLHKHPIANAGVILKGELTVVTEAKKTLRLKAGDTIVEVVNTWHYGKNEGNVSTELIVFYAGIEGQAITVKK